jgi:hypothetical protein
VKYTLKAGTVVALPDGSKYTLKNAVEFTLPLVQFGVMGIHHHGKSRLIASMEYPLLVLGADPMAKFQTYFDMGIVDDKVYIGKYNQPVRIVRDVSGKPIIQVECFLDNNPAIPWGFTALQSRLDDAGVEVRAGMWKSLGLDSWSQLEFIAKLRRSIGAFKVENPSAVLKDDCEQLLKSRLCTLPCNIGVSLHINSKLIDAGGGAMLYEPVATGTLKSGIGSVLTEMYRAVAVPDATLPGGVKYTLQTIPDGRFDCGTVIGAPNGCENDFKALFRNWIAKRAAMVAAQEASTNTAAPAPTEPQKEQVA